MDQAVLERFSGIGRHRTLSAAPSHLAGQDVEGACTPHLTFGEVFGEAGPAVEIGGKREDGGQLDRAGGHRAAVAEVRQRPNGEM